MDGTESMPNLVSNHLPFIPDCRFFLHLEVAHHILIEYLLIDDTPVPDTYWVTPFEVCDETSELHSCLNHAIPTSNPLTHRVRFTKRKLDILTAVAIP